MKKQMTILLTVLVVGCATKQQYWEKPGATAQEFNIDRGQCNAQAFSVPGVSIMQAALVQNSCLQGKGWYLVEK